MRDSKMVHKIHDNHGNLCSSITSYQQRQPFSQVLIHGKIHIFKKLTFFIEILLFFFHFTIAISQKIFLQKKSFEKMHPSMYLFPAMKLPELICPEVEILKNGPWYDLVIVESCPLVPKSPESVQKRRRSCLTKNVIKKPFHFYIID